MVKHYFKTQQRVLNPRDLDHFKHYFIETYDENSSHLHGNIQAGLRTAFHIVAEAGTAPKGMLKMQDNINLIRKFLFSP